MINYSILLVKYTFVQDAIGIGLGTWMYWDVIHPWRFGFQVCIHIHYIYICLMNNERLHRYIIWDQIHYTKNEGYWYDTYYFFGY